MTTENERPEGILISDDGELALDSDGSLLMDSTVRTRALTRLKAHRGKYWKDKTFGSRLFEIKTIKDAYRLAEPHCQEALQDLQDAGEILGVDVARIESDPDTGMVLIDLAVKVSADEMIAIQSLRLGV